MKRILFYIYSEYEVNILQLTSDEMLDFCSEIKKLLAYPEIQSMADYIQHGHTSCLEHCLTVTYYSYLWAKRLHLPIDESSLIRGGLLHDFFLYDWHIKTNHPRFHGFRHPKIALHNAHRYFELTAKECDIISHHMWPLTPIPPLCLEGYLVTFADKWCSLRETFHRPSQAISLHFSYVFH